MARLLVSVRSAVEARAAVVGGASIIDVKEPSRGSLGCADASVWQAVRSVVPLSIPISVALGELNEWSHSEHLPVSAEAWAGLDFCKLGLANAPQDWLKRWTRLREQLREEVTSSPDWVAVVYLDWQAARAPHPEAIVESANAMSDCRAVLFDTWSKSSGARLDNAWKLQVERVRNSGKLIALAGSIDVAAIERWRDWHADIFAVRGAACAGGDRLQSIEAARVSRLAEAIAGTPQTARLSRGTTMFQTSKRTP